MPRSDILLLGDTGHCLSLLCLLLAIFIFWSNQPLHCGRVTVHLHMFASLICSNLTWLVWGHAVIGEAEVWSQNPAWCRVFNFTMTYFTISTYFWMMCEVEFPNFDIDIHYIEIQNILRKPTYRH